MLVLALLSTQFLLAIDTDFTSGLNMVHNCYLYIARVLGVMSIQLSVLVTFHWL